MTPDRFRFDRFVLDTRDRQLTCDDAAVELNTRYLDALALLVREQGKLISKDRFMAEVWRGVPVTDEALTQCIRTLRKQLGDDAARPRFIETVVKHGYRFIAPVEPVGDGSPAEVLPVEPPPPRYDWRQVAWLGAAGTAGAGAAGLCGGLLYGFGAASQPVEAGMGAVSVLLVIACLSLIIAILGGAGVSIGIAAALASGGRQWKGVRAVLGGAAGGLVVGAVVKLIGVDAFNLLFGRSPGDITGAPEGLLLGGAVGLGAWLGDRLARSHAVSRGVLTAALTGAAAGALIPLLGGRMMSGSLVLVGQQFPGSRLRLDGVWRMLGESEFGPVSQAVTGALEGALFSGCIVAAMLLARWSAAPGALLSKSS